MEWKEVRLGDVCSIQRGASPRPIQKFISKEGMPWVKIADATGISSRYISSTSEYIIKEGISKSRIVHPGDLIVSNSATPGLPKFMAIEACVHDGWLIIRDLDGIDKVFLYYVFINIRRRLSNQANGSVFMNLKTDIVKDFVIKLPMLDDQRRIASILSSLDQKIELNNKINADLEEMAQAIFKNWFVDFEPFKDGKFVDSELGMIPEGWKVGSPYEYVKVVYGAPYKSAKFNDNGEGLPLIRIRDLKDCNPQFYTPEILPQTEYVNMGDIVAGMDAEFIPHIWKGNTGLLNQRVCKLMPQQTSISNLFVLYLMKPELEFVQSYKTGTTVSHLGKADIDKFVVVLPPLKVVEECSKILDSILQRIKNISAESRTLSTLRDTLLPRLMSGELEVPE